MKLKQNVPPPSLPTGLSRRGFLYSALAGTAVTALPSLAMGASAGPSPYGSIAPRDATGILLPQGFTARIIAVSGQYVPGTNFEWRDDPDGAATFPDGSGGWYHAVNHERSSNGGVSVIHFDANGDILGAYSVLSGTRRNCAGGPTPWGTWLSCEEYSDGMVWECTVTGAGQGVARPAMGRFNHEAAAVDPVRQQVFLTEDRSDGLFYRFTPSSYPSLGAGTLEAARLDAAGYVSWVTIPDPGASNEDTRYQLSSSQITRFNGGEGIWYQDDKVWFTTKGDNGVWEFDLLTNRITKIWNGGSPLTGVDNITVEQGSQDLFVAEDGGNMEIVIIDNQGNVAPFLRVPNQGGSELTGPCFSPDGTRMYFSSQRGTNGNGITYEVTGPFRGTGATPPPPPPPPVPTGHIVMLENVEFGGNLTEIATNDIALTSDTGASAQWELVDIGGGRYHLINQATGRYLDGDGTATLVGTSSSAASDDEWQLDDFGDEVFTLYNGSHSGYLDANSNNRVYLYGDQNADAQWRFITVSGGQNPPPVAIPEDTKSYALENLRYGGFLTEIGSNDVALTGDLTSAKAHWRFERISGDQYHLVNLNTGRWLDGDGAGNRVGTSSSPAADDVWELNDFASDVFSLRNLSANRWLDADTDDYVRLWNDEQDDAQWRLIGVD